MFGIITFFRHVTSVLNLHCKHFLTKFDEKMDKNVNILLLKDQFITKTKFTD